MIQMRRFILGSIIGAVILAVIIQGVNLSSLLPKITNAVPEWIVLSISVYLAFFIIRAARWKIILANKRKFSSLFHIFQIGYLLNNVFPFHIGEVIRAVILKEKEKVEVGYGLSSIVVERIMDVVAILALTIVVIALIPATQGSQQLLSGTIKNVAIAFALAIIAIVTFAARPQLLIKFLDFTGRARRLTNISNRMKALVLDVANGLQMMSKKRGNFAAAFALTFLSWGVNFIGIYFLFSAVGFHVSAPVIFLGFLGTTLLLIIPSTPGYIGTYEGFWVATFFALGITQVDEVLAVGILSHIVSVALSTCLGAVGLLALKLTFGDVLRAK